MPPQYLQPLIELLAKLIRANSNPDVVTPNSDDILVINTLLQYERGEDMVTEAYRLAFA
ncbi:MAG: hypothetical protein QY314_03190 [Candidatus Dojkabacteria bacterium]|nr:MAG: hypothetical protein QY314_03190 [Candidatus Dojkabacteria bacterium]